MRILSTQRAGNNQSAVSHVLEHDNGVLESVYMRHQVADKLGITRAAMFAWERDGVIPKTPYFDSNGVCFYTEPMIEVLTEALIAVGGKGRRPGKSSDVFAYHVRVRWRQRGLPER